MAKNQCKLSTTVWENVEISCLKWLKFNSKLLTNVGENIELTRLKHLKMYPPLLGKKHLNLLDYKWLKIVVNCQPWFQKILKKPVWNGYKSHAQAQLSQVLQMTFSFFSHLSFLIRSKTKEVKCYRKWLNNGLNSLDTMPLIIVHSFTLYTFFCTSHKVLLNHYAVFHVVTSRELKERLPTNVTLRTSIYCFHYVKTKKSKVKW